MVLTGRAPGVRQSLGRVRKVEIVAKSGGTVVQGAIIR
jgi:hypothetical protein